MMHNNKKNKDVLAIIPARGGSKRIKNKNLIDFFGKPLIQYSITAALEAGIFSKVFVSTDSNKIIKIVNKNDLEVPFKRSKKNSSDSATIKSVLLEVLNTFKKKGFSFKYCCCISPTALFINKKYILESFNKIKKLNLDSVISVSKYQNNISRSLKTNKKDLIQWKYPKYRNKMSQNLNDFYFDTGQFFWIDVEKFLNSEEIITNKSGYIILPNIVTQDINTYEDLREAKFKYSYLLSNLK